MTDHLDTETLSAHLDGRSGGATPRIEAHLAACAACAARQSALQRVVRSVAALPAVSPTAAEAAALRRAVLEGAGSGGHAPVPRLGRWRQRMTWKVYAAAGAVAGLLAGGIGYAAFEGGQAAVTASNVGHRAQKAIEAKQFANAGEVVIYVAHQSSVTDTARALTAAAIPATVRQFEDMLAATPLPASNAAGSSDFGILQAPAPPPPAVKGDLRAPGAAAAPLTPTAASTGSPTSTKPVAPDFAAAPTPIGSLATCVATTAAGAIPTAPLEATEITFQGAPAWLIVLAAFPPGATGATPPASLEIWVQARPACSPLAHSSLAP